MENQSIPNSAHSNGHTGQGPIQAVAAMNVLKHSGGHISGMSNHHNLIQQNERQHHYRGVTAAAAGAGHGGATGPLNMGAGT